MRRRRIGEFELIARYFAPLAKSFPGAGGLLSDNAFLPSDARRDLVVSQRGVRHSFALEQFGGVIFRSEK